MKPPVDFIYCKKFDLSYKKIQTCHDSTISFNAPKHWFFIFLPPTTIELYGIKNLETKCTQKGSRLEILGNKSKAFMRCLFLYKSDETLKLLWAKNFSTRKKSNFSPNLDAYLNSYYGSFATLCQNMEKGEFRWHDKLIFCQMRGS